MSDPPDYLFKILLVGDSGVGKSCLLMRFCTDRFEESTTSTIGVDFKVRHLTLDGHSCKLTVWDTAGQERFRTLTSSYYRGAHGIIFVYDVTQRESFLDLDEVWLKEVDLYSNVDGAIQMVIANKVDLSSQRQVSEAEGHEFAKAHGALYVETSAKANIAVERAFEELVRKMLESPGLASAGGGGRGVALRRRQDAEAAQAGGCAC